MTRRVAITGAGTVNALAQDVPATFDALAAGRVAIGPMDFQDIERLNIRIGAQVRDWAPEARFTRQELALYDRAVQFALEAGRQAVARIKHEPARFRRNRSADPPSAMRSSQATGLRGGVSLLAAFSARPVGVDVLPLPP